MRARAVSLALQGGGALGALTWGVLDRLLEEQWLSFEGISGTSAGALNAVALAHGLISDGREGARRSLDELWLAVSNASYPVETPMTDFPTLGIASASPSKILLGLTRFFSPYQLNPFDINPLRSIVERLFDFERLRKHSPVKLFVGATRVRSGALKVFAGDELTADHVLASACLPAISQAVEVDGESYWDGAYAGNPALYPLVHQCSSKDIVVVMLQPLARPSVPTTVETIRSRITEINFNATFLREMRGLMLARQHARASFLKGRLERRLLSLNFHLIETEDLVSRMTVEKTINPSRTLLLKLKEEGRARAHQWLKVDANQLGRSSTVDLAGLFG